MNRPLICFDVEATGTDPASDKIVQIAYREVGSPTGSCVDLLVNPGCPIPPESTEIHNITDDAVAVMPTFDQVAGKMNHDDAHDAGGDVEATIRVFLSQIRRYQLPEDDREKLEIESNYEEKRVDLAGKIVVGKDGRPTYNIGKARGTAVEDDPGFGNWMLDRDFSENTKIALRSILYPPVEQAEPAVCDGMPF